MNTFVLVTGVAAASLLATSCASTARDALLDIYNDEASASGVANGEATASGAANDEASASGVGEACRVDHKTFATATEAYLATNGTAPTSTADLVPDWIREEPDAWQFDAESPTSFSPVAGGRCDGIDLERDASSTVGRNAIDRLDDAGRATCASDRRQIEISLELYFTVNGRDAETLSDLIPIGVDADQERWTLEPSPDPAVSTPLVVPVEGGLCDD